MKIEKQMKEELQKRLITFRDAIKKDGNTNDAHQTLGETKEAVLRGALDNVSEEYQDHLFDLITEINSLESMNEFNRGVFESTVELIAVQNMIHPYFHVDSCIEAKKRHYEKQTN